MAQPLINNFDKIDIERTAYLGNVFNFNHASTQESTSAWSVPFTRNKSFVHRDELSQVDALCGNDFTRIAIVGLGGVGKSQLAIEHCFRTSRPFVFWVHAANRSRFHEDYQTIATKLGVSAADPQQIARLVNIKLQDLEAEWLLIVDNADDETVLFNGEGDTTTSDAILGDAPPVRYLPTSGRGTILITTRNAGVARRLAEHSVALGPMDAATAMDLLGKRLDIPFTPQEGHELINALDCMPLAITQAAAFITQRNPRISVKDYTALSLRMTFDEGLLMEENSDLHRDYESSNSIIRTLHVSIQQIAKDHPRAADLLSLMSLFDRQGVPKDILVSAFKSCENDLDRSVDVLRKYSLLFEGTGNCIYRMHRLVQLSAKTWMERNGTFTIFQEQQIGILCSAFPIHTDKPEAWPRCQTLYPHIVSMSAYMPQEYTLLQRWVHSILSAQDYRFHAGMYNDAAIPLEELLQKVTERCGEHDPVVPRIVNLLIRACTWQRRHKEAVFFQKQDLEQCKLNFGKDDERTLSAMFGLSLLYSYQERWDEAQDLALKAFKRAKRKYGKKHMVTLKCALVIARTYAQQKRWIEAESLQVQHLEHSKTELGEDHWVTTSFMEDLANVYMDQDRYDEAGLLLEKVIRLHSRSSGDDHVDALNGRATLAKLYFKQGKLDESEQLLLEVIQQSKLRYGDDDLHALRYERDLSSAWMEQGKFDQAQALMEHIVRQSTYISGADSVTTLMTMLDLGIMYRDLRRLEEAREVLETVVKQFELSFGDSHPYTLKSKGHLALSHEALKGLQRQQAGKTESCLEAEVEGLSSMAVDNDDEDDDDAVVESVPTQTKSEDGKTQERKKSSNWFRITKPRLENIVQKH